jgi:hypothetical protein
LELAGEEVDTEVAVLASLRRYVDTDDLAGTALEDDQVADADEVAWDCDGVSGDAAARLDEPDALDDASTFTRRAATFVFNDHLLALTMVEGMQDAVCGPFNTATERVVFALVVVVTHVSGWLVVDDFFFLDFYFCGWSTSFVFDVVVWLRAAAVVAFGDVDLTLDDLVSSLASVVLNVDGVSGLATVGSDVKDLVLSLASVVVDVDGVSGLATIGSDVEGLVLSLASFVVNVDGVSGSATVDGDINVGLFDFTGTPIPMDNKSAAGSQPTWPAVVDAPFSGELYLRISLTITFLVDADVYVTAGFSGIVTDIDFFAAESSIFPSGARGAT